MKHFLAVPLVLLTVAHLEALSALGELADGEGGAPVPELAGDRGPAG